MAVWLVEAWTSHEDVSLVVAKSRKAAADAVIRHSRYCWKRVRPDADANLSALREGHKTGKPSGRWPQLLGYMAQIQLCNERSDRMTVWVIQ